MIVGVLVLALAALVTFASIAVHDARRHAKPLRQTLVLIGVCLGLFVGLAALIGQSDTFRQRAASVGTVR